MTRPAEQLGLALNLESLIQIQSQLAAEINRDIESPNDSKFHYAIPRMKNTLLSMEQVRICERRVLFCARSWLSGALGLHLPPETERPFNSLCFHG